MARSATTDRLSAVPPELLIDIFSYLPASDMCRTRVLSKPWKDFVDANETRISLPTIRYHQQRLRSTYDALLYAYDVAFDELFKRIIGHYGIPGSANTQLEILGRLCGYYTTTRFHALQRTDQRGLTEALRSFAYHAWQTGKPLEHGPIDCNTSDQCEQCLRRKETYRADMAAAKMFASIIGHEGLAHIVEAMHEIANASESLISEINYPDEPESWITHCYPSYDRPDPPTDTQVRLLTASLGIPWLSWSDCVAYCAGSEQTLELIASVCKKRSVEATVFEEAAILGDIYIW
ncbi:hypothetical protein LTR09_000118 [Extremus antarcticus]|uniref:F-box domain-containing protein n=1 Tax=Extremus antarcticus TaxID=702011 RepID=A0AAJ0GJ39_9PEZI|nr:hypothetical protein LTR09_000118 [Extremus antarcticus]